jgi:hypothetical protein
MVTEWSSPHPEKFKTQKSSSEVSAIWGKDGILLVDYLEKGGTIMTKYYITFLDKVKKQLVSKHQG